MLSRRDAIRGLTLTVGLAASGWAERAMAAAPAPATLSWTPTALTADQARLVDVVAELIIPATDTPGARDAGVPQFVDRTVATYYDKGQAERFLAGLARMDVDARGAYGDIFVSLTPQQQVELLTRYDQEAEAARNQTPDQAHFFPVIEDLVTVGYFTSELGATKALIYEPVPGAYHGCVPLAEIGRAWAMR
ncbi:gluconate 2-dehydrogenase subunit 3 family protein [Caulobacter sp. 1776]|uniref:gluconate 2-dehydrogenase subunit 3 family protein n=1 Tax=Caulobacter sp. 1776 TaxID=3156420 RepID=UPI003391B781